MRVFATPDAARTFNDDLEEVAASGVQIVDEDRGSRAAGCLPPGHEGPGL